MTSIKRSRWPVAIVAASAALVFGGCLGVAQAQPQPAGNLQGLQNPDTEVDPPGRAARIAEVTGQVWLYSVDTGEWVSADANRPMTTGDRLATDPGARAEIQLGSTTLRLDSSTELEVVQLDDDHFALELHDGSVIARLRDPLGANQFEMNTDEGRFVTERIGSYRFDRFNVPNGSGSNITRSDATVYSGAARYEGSNSALPIPAGQRAEFWIDASGVAQYTTLQPAGDSFASWSNSRDRQVVVANGQTQRYVSPEMTGAEELDRYGRWDQDPEYGAVWVPTAVAVDWAPYSHGHWTWVRPWGWTWVDDAPWGFAPFHYGRWVYARNNWCWTPGTRVARPVYAPALVAWIGGPRANVSISVGGGPGVGWLPLAPREVYVPSYRSSPRYVRNVNITNVTNVTVINNVIANPGRPREFENRRFPRAITVVPEGVMRDRKPVAPAAAQYRQTPWVRDLQNQPQRIVAANAPPVAAPVAPSRGPDPRNVRPPPGVAERPAVSARQGLPSSRPEGDRRNDPRDRNEADRRGGDGRDARDPRDPRDRSGVPPAPGRAQPGVAEAQQRPGQAPQGQPQQPPAAQPAIGGAPAGANPNAPRPGFGDRGDDRRGNDRGRDARGQPERGGPPAGPGAVTQPAQAQPQVPPQPQTQTQPQPQVTPPANQPRSMPAPVVPGMQVERPPQRTQPPSGDDRRVDERRQELQRQQEAQQRAPRLQGSPEVRQQERPQERPQERVQERAQERPQEARPQREMPQARPDRPQVQPVRPVEPPPAPRAPEVQRVAPPAPVVERRAEPRPQAEPPKAAETRRDEPKRDEPGKR